MSLKYTPKVNTFKLDLNMIVIIDSNMIIKDKSLISKLFRRKIIYISYYCRNQTSLRFNLNMIACFCLCMVVVN